MPISTAPFTYIQEILPDGTALELVPVKGGVFKIGSKDGEDNEKPIQTITVSDFYLAKYPITTEQYLAFVKATDSHYPHWMEPGGEYNLETGSNKYYEQQVGLDRPVVGVSWHDAVAYCAWLSEISGHSYWLPSEAEWEYAARGGIHKSPYEFAGSHKLKMVGWYRENSHGETKPVGLKAPNALGLYDMSGNVREWCQDFWHDNYKGIPRDGSPWLRGRRDTWRMVRGGSSGDYDFGCRVSNRFGSESFFRGDDVGFRPTRY